MRNVIILKIGRGYVMLAGIKKPRIDSPEEFIGEIRAVNRKLAVQAVNAKLVAGKEHALEVVRQTLYAKQRGTMLSKKLEIDVLLRLACTNQISRALDELGLRRGTSDVLVIAVGSAASLRSLCRHLARNYILNSSVLGLDGRKRRMLARHHGVTKREVNACAGGHDLADILAERASLL